MGDYLWIEMCKKEGELRRRGKVEKSGRDWRGNVVILGDRGE